MRVINGSILIKIALSLTILQVLLVHQIYGQTPVAAPVAAPVTTPVNAPISAPVFIEPNICKRTSQYIACRRRRHVYGTSVYQIYYTGRRHRRRRCRQTCVTDPNSYVTYGWTCGRC